MVIICDQLGYNLFGCVSKNFTNLRVNSLKTLRVPTLHRIDCFLQLKALCDYFFPRSPEGKCNDDIGARISGYQPRMHGSVVEARDRGYTLREGTWSMTALVLLREFLLVLLLGTMTVVAWVWFLVPWGS